MASNARNQPDPEPAPDSEPGPGRASRRVPRGWRVVARRVNDFGDAVYDVYEGEERRAWGIKDRTTAQRWLARLSGGAADASEGDNGDEGEEEPAGYTPRRVWWNDT